MYLQMQMKIHFGYSAHGQWQTKLQSIESKFVNLCLYFVQQEPSLSELFVKEICKFADDHRASM
jgi:hypothetical protein